MEEEPIGYLKFNDFVNKLVDNQIWMEKIDSFTQKQPRIHNNDQILDSLEGKVNTEDGVIDYTELMNIVSPNLKTRCYIASFTGIYKSNFKNGIIKKKIADNLNKLAGERDFAVMKSESSGTNSLEEAANAESMSPRLRNPEMPLGYLDADAKKKIKNYAQQVILYDEVAQLTLGLTGQAGSAKISKDRDWNSKYAAFSIMLETTKEDASEHIKSLGTDYVAGLINELNIDVLQKFMRNMDTEYLKKLKTRINPEKYNDLIEAVELQRCNPLKPSNLNICIEFEKVTYADTKIDATKSETIQRAKRDKAFRDKLLKMCIFEKPSKFEKQQEYRLVLIARETQAGQKFPCIMNLQYYKQPLLPDCNGNMQHLLPIQAKRYQSGCIYYLRQAYFDDLGKSITEERDNKV